MSARAEAARGRIPASLRLLLRQKRFATLAVLSLGVAIALNTTMYSVLDAFMNPKLDLPNPHALYEIRFFGYTRHLTPVDERNAAYTSLTTVADMAATTGAYWDRWVERGDRAREVGTLTVSPNYFAVIGSRPAAGRLLTEADMDATPRPVVVSERLWKEFFPEREEFGPATVIVGDEPRAIVGLLRRDSDLPHSGTDVWQLPTHAQAPTMLKSIARLRPGVTPQQVRAELATLTPRFIQSGSTRSRHIGFRMSSLVRFPFAQTQFTWALIGSVVAVLLVACANLANLQLARGLARTRELATRAAVGASRRQIIGQLTAESAWLAGAGLLVGGLLTWWGMHLVEAYTPPVYGELEIQAQISWRVMLFAVTVTLLCLMLVGLLPAVKLSRVDLNELLKTGAGTGRSKSIRRRYGVLVAVEVALALALLSSAGLLMSMAAEVHRLELPFDARGLQMGVTISPDAPARDSRRVWSARLIQQALAAGGITHAATVGGASPTRRAVSADDSDGDIRVVAAPQWGYSIVSPDIFRAMGSRIVQGRDFARGEFAEPLVIVDEQTAACLWPGANPVGRLVKLDSAHVAGPWLRVIGVVASPRVPLLNYRERILVQPPCPQPARPGGVFVLNAADTTTMTPTQVGRRTIPPVIGLVIRPAASGNAMATGLRVRRAIMTLPGVDRVSIPALPWEMERLLALQKGQTFVAVLFSVFALLGAALAATGVYAIVSFSVAQRTREFGVRIAVGAGVRDIRELVMRDGTLLTLLGILAGVLITWKSAGLLREFLFSDWDQYDSRVFAAAAVLLFGTAWLASWIPARRATRIDPVEALRND